MNRTDFMDALGMLDDRYIESAISYRAEKASVSRAKRRFAVTALAAVMGLLLMGAGVVAAVKGDLWQQQPSKDPVESVRAALENQEGKDYTIAIRIDAVEVDEAETEKVVDRFIRGVIAERRGWSDEYLQEHFVVVRAEYFAEYDCEKTTRSDGDVVQYFYLTRDEKTGRWTIVDNSGNVNWSADSDETQAGKTLEEQIFLYLSEEFTRAYAPYYDGLRYEIRGYTEELAGNEVTATIFWTMYHLGKGWDVASDEGVEWDANYHLLLKGSLREDGTLDRDSVSVWMNSNPGRPETFDTPLDQVFPDQLAD